MKIAITGTMGGGKSQASAYIKSQGYDVYDTDKMVHAYYKQEGRLYQDILDLFGADILDENLDIDRRKIASIVFNDKNLLNKLEGLTHPAVLKDIMDTDDDGKLVFFEVPLLFEAKMESAFDCVIMVRADDDIRYARLMKRGMDLETIRLRSNNQLPELYKQDRSDYIIDNSSDLATLYKQLDDVLHICLREV